MVDSCVMGEVFASQFRVEVVVVVLFLQKDAVRLSLLLSRAIGL